MIDNRNYNDSDSVVLIEGQLQYIFVLEQMADQ